MGLYPAWHTRLCGAGYAMPGRGGGQSPPRPPDKKEAPQPKLRDNDHLRGSALPRTP